MYSSKLRAGKHLIVALGVAVALLSISLPLFAYALGQRLAANETVIPEPGIWFLVGSGLALGAGLVRNGLKT